MRPPVRLPPSVRTAAAPAYPAPVANDDIPVEAEDTPEIAPVPVPPVRDLVAEKRVRDAQLEESLVACAEVLSRPATLRRRDGGDAKTPDEISQAAAGRAAGCEGAMARLRPHRGDDHPRAGEVIALYDALATKAEYWIQVYRRERKL